MLTRQELKPRVSGSWGCALPRPHMGSFTSMMRRKTYFIHASASIALTSLGSLCIWNSITAPLCICPVQAWLWEAACSVGRPYTASREDQVRQASVELCLCRRLLLEHQAEPQLRDHLLPAPMGLTQGQNTEGSQLCPSQVS